MKFVIVTGMSGAGKSITLKMMEDMGYFCVDNMPVALLKKFTELLLVPNEEISKIALGIDIRSGSRLEEVNEIIDELERLQVPVEILFLDATDDVLIKRYKETRRSHPLAVDGRIGEGLEIERKRIAFLKKRATYIIETSRMLTRELKKELASIFVENKEYKNLYVTVMSFGFKYGIPNDADLVFDVRFLPNPYYVDELRSKSGNDKEVQDYVMNCDAAKEFLNKLTDMLSFLIPHYVSEGKNQLVIAIGCTGGKHRSVTLANGLFEALQTEDRTYGVKVEHRDIEKDAITKAK